MTENQRTRCVNRAIVAALILLTFIAGPALATDKTCLTGDDPSVAADAAQIPALEAQIAASCPCDDFDGSEGNLQRDYRKCVSPLIKAAIENGELRAKCKSRIAKAYKRSSCGDLDVLPCLETKGGKIRCRISTPEKCQSDSRYTRVACSSYRRCVDAGDHNGDYLVDSNDSAECRVAAEATATMTATATATQTIADTATATIEPTQTPTAIPTDTPTAVPTATPSDTPTEPATVEPTVTPTACVGSGPIIPRIDINKDDDPQSPPVPPDPAASNCFPQTINGGGCVIHGLDGSAVNVFDASASVDGGRCPGDPLPSYHWEMFKPPQLNGLPYSAAGITGYHGPVLTILPHSLPALVGESSDILWRVRLTITSNVTGQTTQSWFSLDYQQSALSLQMSTTCQSTPANCPPFAANGLPATEPT